MARLLTLGAEDGSREWLAAFCTAYGSMDVVGSENGLAAARTGAFCYQANGDAGYFVFSPSGTPPTELYLGFAVWANQEAGDSAGSPFLVFVGPDIGLYITAGPTLTAKRGATTLATGAIGTKAWKYVEVYLKAVDGASGALTVKVDGSTIINYSGDTVNTTTAITAIGFYGYIASTTDKVYLYDDIVLNDTAGGSNDTWPGEVRLWPLRLRGAGDNDDFSRGGVDRGNNFAQVREVGSSVSWLENATNDEYVLMAVESPDLPAGVTIVQVITQQVARVQAGGWGLKGGVKAATTESWGSKQTPATAWSGVAQVWLTNPDTAAAWVEADLASLQIGAKTAS